MSAYRNVLIFIPTYNEAENVEALFTQLMATRIDADILFMDDNSPDSTGQIIDRLAHDNANVHAIHRAAKLGIGSAHKDGIAWAYAQGYRLLVTMDCDFTHSPSAISEFLRHAEHHDVVVGSRYMRHGSLRGWNLLRKTLTRTGHFLTSTLLGMPQDATGAFRLYRLDRIPAGLFGRVASSGYSFFFESLFVLRTNGFSIHEIPIDLPARTYGHSKMRMTHAIASMLLLFHLCMRRVFRKSSLAYSPDRQVNPPSADAVTMQREWDEYWSSKRRPTSTIYDWIAVIYRKLIIRPTLTHFISSYFSPESQLLHAGCGSGQVDTDIAGKAKISALDISPEALRIYERTNPGAERFIQGSIFDIPLPPESFDGIYNLGVMEHFTVEEIHCILREFYRVLKPGGRIVLFWPPSFGVTVNVLKFVHWVARTIFSSDLKLHPDEITHVRSRRQVQTFLDSTGFTFITLYFGVRDLFTHAVVVAEKPVSSREPNAALRAQTRSAISA